MYFGSLASFMMILRAPLMFPTTENVYTIESTLLKVHVRISEQDFFFSFFFYPLSLVSRC